MRKLGTIVVTALATSCALVGGLDDYHARSLASDASAAGDATESDAAVVPDGIDDGSDGGGTDDGGTQRICDRYPDAQFCDDFDVSALGARWDDQNALGGTLALDATAPFSAPLFLEATIGPVAQNAYGPRLRKNLGPHETITIRARIRIDPSKSTIPLRIDVQTAESHDIRLRHAGGSTRLEEVNYTLTQSQTSAAFAKMLDATWQEVVIKISFKTRKVDVTIGGASALVGQDLTLGDWSGTTNVAVLVGLPFVVTQGTPVTSGIDDFVVLPE